MRRLWLLWVLAFLPTTAFALYYGDASHLYKDRPFSKAEAAAISLLSHESIVHGNADGTFAPNRTLNRAEFVTIAMQLRARLHPDNPLPEPTIPCFRDVRWEMWFSHAVCSAKELQIVQGYPLDGIPPDRWAFRPDKPVTYAEAAKILVVTFGMELSPSDIMRDQPWYEPYLQVVTEHKLGIPGLVKQDTPITRGQMARLAAAFLAESEGELSTYRQAERGKLASSRSEVSSVPSVPSVPSSYSSSSSSSSYSSVTPLPDFPARSRLLLLGTRTQPIASNKFFIGQEPVWVRTIIVKLENLYDSTDTLYMIDDTGKQVATLSKDVYDLTEKTWRAQLPTATMEIPKSTDVILGVLILLKEVDKGGVPEELIQVDDVRLTVEGQWSGSTFESIPAETLVYPQHQTVQAEIISVRNAGAAQDILVAGAGQQLASFIFEGTVLPGKTLSLEELQFRITATSDVTTANWTLGTPDSPTRSACTVSGSDTTAITCTSLPTDLATIDPKHPRVLRLFGDVTLTNPQTPSLQINLSQAGAIGENSSIRWTDGTGHYTWIESDSPIARGTLWK